MTLSPRLIRLLIVNPNTTVSMSKGLEAPIAELLSSHKNVSASYFTSPADPNSPGSLPSINSPADADATALHVFPHLKPLLKDYDGILIACYSEHPLVKMVGDELASLTRQEIESGKEPQDIHKKYVSGIFEASVAASLGFLAQTPLVHVDTENRVVYTEADSKGTEMAKFGIVSTGKVWEEGLSRAVDHLLAKESGSAPSTPQHGSGRFAGVETTGLSAVELHDLPAEEVRAKMAQATARLVKKAKGEGKVQAVCLGCAGMVGLESAVREGCISVLGPVEGREVRVVDGVRAGVEWLVSACRLQF